MDYKIGEIVYLLSGFGKENPPPYMGYVIKSEDGYVHVVLGIPPGEYSEFFRGTYLRNGGLTVAKVPLNLVSEPLDFGQYGKPKGYLQIRDKKQWEKATDEGTHADAKCPIQSCEYGGSMYHLTEPIETTWNEYSLDPAIEGFLRRYWMIAYVYKERRGVVDMHKTKTMQSGSFSIQPHPRAQEFSGGASKKRSTKRRKSLRRRSTRRRKSIKRKSTRRRKSSKKKLSRRRR